VTATEPEAPAHPPAPAAPPTVTPESRVPSPLGGVYADLVAALPDVLGGYVYFVRGESSFAALKDRWPGDTWFDRWCPHWVPGAVFDRLTGAVCGTCRIYPTAAAAAADLAAAWAAAGAGPLPLAGGGA
jgi:hypothetical protein